MPYTAFNMYSAIMMANTGSAQVRPNWLDSSSATMMAPFIARSPC